MKSSRLTLIASMSTLMMSLVVLNGTLSMSRRNRKIEDPPPVASDVEDSVSEPPKLVEHSLVYLNPRSEDKEIIVQVGDGIIFQTNTYTLVSAHLSGEMTIKIDGGLGVLDAISNDSKTPTIFFSPQEGFGELQRNILLYAVKANKPNQPTKVTIKFIDSDHEELESTTYTIVVRECGSK